MKPGYLKALPGVLKQFSDFLGDRKWFAGDKVRHLLNMGSFTLGNLLFFFCPLGARTPQQAENHIHLKHYGLMKLIW